MITEERLKELIEKEATIYSVQNNKIFEIELKKDFFEADDTLTICMFNVFDECLELNNDNGENEYAWLIEYLFETKADAEWDLEFENVEKRIKFVKPKPFKDIENGFCLYNFHGFAMYRYEGVIKLYEENNSDIESSIIFDKPFNEENYTEACRLIKKLFMGEEINEN